VKAPRCTFAKDEQEIQLTYFKEHLAERSGHLGRPFQLKPGHRLDGLLPQVRETTRNLFQKQLGIQFHTYVGHGRSSQACCINFLMPLADKPDVLSRWIGHVLDIPPPAVLPIEKEVAGAHRYVAFEYTGPDDKDYLGEAAGNVPQRGANATASDAAIGFVGADGVRHLLLIEWKYTEQYQSHRLSEDNKGKRIERYAKRLLAPHGPVRADLGVALTDFFHEPFYQFVRQQMLAWEIEDKSNAFDRVRVLHLSPSGNRALHRITAPRLATVGGVEHQDAFDAFRACLVEPDDFIPRTIETAFAPLAHWAEANWWAELAARYPTLCNMDPTPRRSIP
jgi:hypothetical protein